jgi:ribonuclease P protein component
LLARVLAPSLVGRPVPPPAIGVARMLSSDGCRATRAGAVALSLSGGRGEAHLPAQQSTPVEAARFPAPDVDSRRASHPEGAPGQGSGPAVGLIWSIRDRAAFDRFRTDGRRVRAGALWCSWIADEEARPPRVGYAVGRSVGGAVVRNRLRRQIRHALVDEVRASGLPAGWYLIGASPAAAGLDGATVQAAVRRLVEGVRAGAGR